MYSSASAWKESDVLNVFWVIYARNNSYAGLSPPLSTALEALVATHTGFPHRLIPHTLPGKH